MGMKYMPKSYCGMSRSCFLVDAAIQYPLCYFTFKISFWV